MKKTMFMLIMMVVLPALLVACNGNGDNSVSVAATSTLIPPAGALPDPSATPFVTRTPLPTVTQTPTLTPLPSDTPPPSQTPTPVPIIGIIQSLNTVNVRSGPGISYSAIATLTPGTGVEVLQTNPEGDWLLIEFETEDGDLEVGWVAEFLLFIQDPPTPIPTFTLTPDLTALALGTGTPIGGGTVTATPPRSAVTATPVGTGTAETNSIAVATSPGTLTIPTLDIGSIDQTATALAGGSAARTTPQPPVTRPPGNATTAPTADEDPGEDADEESAAQPTSSGPSQVRQGADIFAMCDNPEFGVSPPSNMAAGSTAEVYWAWLVKDRELMDQHLANVNYEVRINGRLLSNWEQYGQPVQNLGNAYGKYWYVPVGELEAGDYRVTYRATWSQQISDGWALYGPGTRNVVEEGSCTFTVR
jgi:hypothetical protein